jgi:GT2 family glycosyltransferase
MRPHPPAPSPLLPPDRPGEGESWPLLTGVVVHWRNEELLAELAAAWPRDPRFELLVVDNGSTVPWPPLPGGVRVLRPGRNLGFAGGANAGIAEARGEILLILNPDVVPDDGALECLLEGFAALPDAAGLAPRLTGPAGEPQAAWQLRKLPSAWELVLQALPLPAFSGAGPEPAAGEPAVGEIIEQPAAAALALRRTALSALGGFDPAFHPAWFEDVDLARRLRQAGRTLHYWPAAGFRHRLGSTVPRLGYGPFLFVYYRNLTRYLAKHHGRGWAWMARAVLVPGVALRLLALPLRRPRRAASRREALSGLLALLAGAVSGWSRPRRLAEEGF